MKYFFSFVMGHWYVLDDHDEERQFNAKSLRLISGAGDVRGCYVRSHYL